MHSVYVDADVPDEVRRERLYQGQLFVYSPRPAMLALVRHARSMIEQAFGGIDPRQAQHQMPVEKYVEICAPLKPTMIASASSRSGSGSAAPLSSSSRR